MKNVADLIAHIRREFAHVIQAGPEEIAKLFRLVDRPNDRLVIGSSGVPEAVNCPIGRYIFLPAPHASVDRLTLDHIKKHLTRHPSGEPEPRQLKRAKYPDMLLKCLDIATDPRPDFKESAPDQWEWRESGLTLTREEVLRITVAWDDEQKAKRSRQPIESVLESHRGTDIRKLFKSYPGSSNYIFAPTGEKVTYQRAGRLVREFGTEPLTKSPDATNAKRAHLRWLADQADESA